MFERGKMIIDEGLTVLQERMKTIDPDDNQTYKFLGVEKSDGINKKDLVERMKIKLSNQQVGIVNQDRTE